MTYSLNEVEAMSRRAARGAGYDWGLSEEAGKAVRWLCAHGLDGCAALAEVLERFDTVPADRRRPQVDGGGWSGPAGEICPLSAGATLSDRAAMLPGEGIRLLAVRAPVLLVPFAAMAAAQTGRAVTLAWPGATAVSDGRNTSLAGTAVTGVQTVTVGPGGTVATPLASRGRARPDAGAWAVLGRLAHRTYAPATEQSRALGAGAGLSDND